MEEFLGLLFILIVYVGGAAVGASAGGVAGGAVGLGEAVYHVFASLVENFNYRRRDWQNPPEADPAVRSYFFGPFQRQLLAAFRGVFTGISEGNRVLTSHRDAVSLEADLHDIVGPAMKVFAWVYYLAGVVSLTVLSLLISFYIFFILLLIVLAISVVAGVILLITRLADSLFLRVHHIRADCPVHKGTYRVPAFRCSNPECGLLHRHLVPNAYGIWHHRCLCGTQLPTTFLTGRSRLQAYCPVPGCEAKMVASDARPVVFQLIGGSHAGKSVFLASATHLLRRQIAQCDGLGLEIPEDYQSVFDQLERWYAGTEPCAKTTDLNSQMYPLLVSMTRSTRRVLTFYDIAGERFSIDARSGDQQQLQLGYCDSILILLDPFSSGTLRTRREQDGMLPDSYSSDRAEDVVVGFVNYLIHLGVLRAGRKYPIPVYVLIAKSDEPEVYAELGPEPMRRAITARRTGENPPTVGQVRDEVCREFLRRNELHEVLNALSHFETVHFYPVSAMGHGDVPGAAYAPWGIESLLRDVIAQADPELSLFLSADTSERR